MKWSQASKRQQDYARRLHDRAIKAHLESAVIGGYTCNATPSQIIQDPDAWEAAIRAAEQS